MEFTAPYLHPGDLATLFDFLPTDTRLWIDDAGRIEGMWETAWEALGVRVDEAEQAGRFFTPRERWFLDPHQIRDALRSFPTVELDPLVGISSAGSVRLTCYTLSDLAGPRTEQATPTMKPIADRIREWATDGRRTILVVPGANRESSIQLE